MNQHRQEQEDYEDDEDLDDEDQQEEEMDDEDEAQQDPRAAREQQGAAASANVAANVPQLEGYDRAELIGQGAYGMVFRGRRRESQEVCAIKHIAFGENNMEGMSALMYIESLTLFAAYPLIFLCFEYFVDASYRRGPMRCHSRDITSTRTGSSECCALD